MPFIVIPVQGGRINYLILHHDGTSATALTIDCPTKTFLDEVYGLFHLLDDKEIYNHDEGANKQFHDQLHAEMQLAMNTNLIGTITNYHQHWVSRAHKSNLLLFGHANNILKAFKAKTWITGGDALAALQNAYT